MPDILDAPEAAEPTIPEDAVFDPAALDPSSMMEGKVVVKPDPAADPAEPDTKPEVADPAAAAKPDPAPAQPAIRDSDEPRNVAELRRNYKQAKADRDQLKTDRDTLAAKLADLEPKATNYEKERTALQQRLDEREASLAEKDAALRRTNARELPEWKEKAGAIHTAAKSVDEILALPAIKEAGVTHTMETLLNPSAKAAINETLRVLNDAGMYAEAQELMEAHRSVQVWRSDLRKIEADTVEEAKTWSEKREVALADTFRSVRAALAVENPVFDTRSAEYQALPKEVQEKYTEIHKESEALAQQMLNMKPQQLAAESYRGALALRLRAQVMDMFAAKGKADDAKIVELTQKLAAYEAAAGGAAAVGGTRSGGGEAQTPEDEAAKLDPTNFPGFGGFGK